MKWSVSVAASFVTRTIERASRHRGGRGGRRLARGVPRAAAFRVRSVRPERDGARVAASMALARVPLFHRCQMRRPPLGSLALSQSNCYTVEGCSPAHPIGLHRALKLQQRRSARQFFREQEAAGPCCVCRVVDRGSHVVPNPDLVGAMSRQGGPPGSSRSRSRCLLPFSELAPNESIGARSEVNFPGSPLPWGPSIRMPRICFTIDRPPYEQLSSSNWDVQGPRASLDCGDGQPRAFQAHRSKIDDPLLRYPCERAPHLRTSALGKRTLSSPMPGAGLGQYH